MSRKQNKKELSDYEKGFIDGAKAGGMKNVAISELLEVTESCIRGYCKRRTSRGTHSRASPSGRPRVTTPREDRSIMREVKKNRRITLDELQVECSLQHVSPDTISARIHDLLDFQSYWTDLKPRLTKQHKENRLKWATEHLGWTSEQWERVLWSDESPFTVRFQGRERVWRGANERYIVEAITPTRKSDQKINVWGCFASNGVGKLVLIDGLMDAKQYVKIIEKNVPRTARKLFGFDDYLFQQDNDPSTPQREPMKHLIGLESKLWSGQLNLQT